MRATTIVSSMGAMLLLLFGPILVLQAQANPPEPTPPATPAHAEVMPLAASRSVLLGFAESNDRAIVVGERGHILVSESRSDWRQIDGVPTRATLTAVSAIGDRAWAVGHDGTILHSQDGGLSWALQRQEIWTPAVDDEEFFSRAPSFGAPLLDVLFIDADTGYAIGAYALLLRTRDGGASWEKVRVTVEPVENLQPDDDLGTDESWTFDEDDLTLDAEVDPHLNGIVQLSDGTLFIVAERGSAFRSTDRGDSWERIQLPYDGSMFGVLALGDGHLLAFGLRGNVLESRDGGDSWNVLPTGTELSLMGGAALPGGGAVVVGANGAVLHRQDADSAFTLSTFVNENDETPVLANVLPLGTRILLLSGERGLGRYQVNGTEASR